MFKAMKKTEKAAKPVKEEAAAQVEVRKPEEPKSRFKDFDEMISYFKTKIDDVAKSTMVVCWEIGREALIIKAGKKYGEKTLENFVEEMNIPKLDLKTLYKYTKFAETYSEEDLKRILTKKHVGWGMINMLIHLDDDEKRREFEDKLDSGELKPSQLAEAIQEFKQEKAEEEDKQAKAKGEKKEPKRNFTRNFLKASTFLNQGLEFIPRCESDLKEVGELETDTDAYDKAEEAASILYDVARTVVDALEKYMKSFDKTLSVEGVTKGK